jgi:hypothetical protein
MVDANNRVAQPAGGEILHPWTLMETSTHGYGSEPAGEPQIPIPAASTLRGTPENSRAMLRHAGPLSSYEQTVI